MKHLNAIVAYHMIEKAKAILHGEAEAGSVQRMVSSDREQLIRLASRVAYVLAHDYRLGAPVGTREVALRDLMMEYSITVDYLQAANNADEPRSPNEK